MEKGIGIILYYDKNDKINLAMTTDHNENMEAAGYGQAFLDMIKSVENVNDFSRAVEEYNDKFDLSIKSEPCDIDCNDEFGFEQEDILKEVVSAIAGEYNLFVKNLTDQELQYDDYHMLKPDQTLIAKVDEFDFHPFLYNNESDQRGFKGLEPLEDISRIPRNVEWEGNVYIELYPFTQKTYDTVLITDPADPNYVGSFKDLKKEYFDYLQAKGRGEDVKSPITVNNLQNKDDRVRAVTYGHNNEPSDTSYNDGKTIITSDRAIHMKAGDLETTFDKSASCIQERVSIDLLNGKTSGSFTYNELVLLTDADLRDIQNHFFPSDYFVYMEPSPKTGSLFVEIQDKETRECLVSFNHKYNPLEMDVSNFGFHNYDEIIIETDKRFKCFIEDKDFDEFQKEEAYEKENGNCYKYYLDKHENDLDIKITPITMSFDSWLKFKKSELTQTNYYTLCDTDKISFKEFKEKKFLPLNLLNKRTLNDVKNKILEHNFSDYNNKMNSELERGSGTLFVYLYEPTPTLDLCNYGEFLGKKNIAELFDKYVESGTSITSINISQNIKHYFDEDIAVFSCKDYGDTIEGNFIFRNTEFEFDYDAETSDITLHKFDYDIEDNETGYYKEEELPALLQNETIQDLIFDQIDLEVNNFIAEQRYGSLDDMLLAAEEKAGGSKSIKSKDDLEL